LSTAARVLSSEFGRSGLPGGVAPLGELVEKCQRAGSLPGRCLAHGKSSIPGQR